MPTTFQKAIGAFKDQTTISLAKVYSSSQIEVAVVRATTHDDLPVDERHVYRVLQLVSSNKTYAAGCARAIGKRISRTRNWIVALKALMLVLRIFKDGDPYFPKEVLQAMKKGANILNLSDFRDESHSDDPWDYTAFVRTFALYLDERLNCFLAGKLQRRYMYIERDGSHSFRKTTNESVCDLKPSILLDRIVSRHRLLQRAIATKPTGSAKMNRLVQISLYTVVKESFDFYKDIYDGLSVILDSFFHLNYEARVCAFQVYVKAAKQFEELDSFYSLCKTIDVGPPSEYPRVQIISEALIEDLKRFMKDRSSPTNMKPPNKSLLSGLGNGGQPKLDKRDEIDDPFEKKMGQEELLRVGSAQLVPVKNSTIDLLSLDDWPQEEERREEHERKQDLIESFLLNDLTNVQQAKSSKDLLLQSSSGKGWELILADSISPVSHSQDHCVYDFSNQQVYNYSRSRGSETKKGWELALAAPPIQQQTGIDTLSNTFKASTVLTPCDQSQPQFSPLYHYNPFLATTNPPSTSGFGRIDPFFKQPTFQTTTHRQTDACSLASPPQPLFLLTAHNRNGPFSQALHSDAFASAQHPDQYEPLTVGSSNRSHHDPFAASSHSSQDETFPPQIHINKSDPFATYHQNEDHPFTQIINQQNLLKQQHLWLQHQ